MELRLRTITPLHVGDGSQLHSLDYVLWNKRYYRVSQRRFEQFLRETDGDNSAMPTAAAFADWAGDLADKIESAERDRRNAGPGRGGRDYNQELSYLRSQYTLLQFAKKMRLERPFTDFLQRWVPSLPLMMSGDPKQEIRGFLRDGDGQPYLPGSTVKGSIRTALLYHYLSQHANPAEIAKELQKEVAEIQKEKAEADKRRLRFNLDRYRKKFGTVLEEAAFFAEMTTERGQTRTAEAQDDLMRCVLVADTPIPPEALALDNIDLYLVKKLPRGGGHQAQKQSQSPAVEAIEAGQVLHLHLDFNIELLLRLHQQPGEGGLRVGREQHFKGWRSKAAVLFGLVEADFSSVPTGAKPDHPSIQALRKKALSHILACVQRFSTAQAEALAHWQEYFCQPKHNGRDDARKVERGAQAVGSVDSLRLHLGFATGFEGMTEALYLLKAHKPLFADIMELFGIGDSPTAWKNRRPGETYRANPDQFPKSRRLVTRPAEALPLGWLQWADDPAAAVLPAKAVATASAPATPVAQSLPVYLKSPLKQGVEVDAEIVACGTPNRLRLYLREGHTPTVELRYGQGFKPEDLGRIVVVRVSGLKGKEEVVAVQFVRFKNT